MDSNSGEVSLEQQVNLLKQQLQDAQRLTALGELVGTTTHEFNNVLMTVLNYAKMGLRHRDDETRDKALQKILKAAERAAKAAQQQPPPGQPPNQPPPKPPDPPKQGT